MSAARALLCVTLCTIAGACASRVTAPPASAPLPVSAPQSAGAPRVMELLSPNATGAPPLQLRGMIPNRYPGVARIVGLDHFEELQLFDLLAKQMSEGPRMRVSGELPPREAMPEAMRAALDRQVRGDAELLALLGPERFARWQQYEANQSGHLFVSQFRARLAVNGEAISNETSDRLVSAIAESDRAATQQQMRSATNLPSRAEVRFPDVEENARRLAERQGRVLGVAAPILGPLHADALRRWMDEQAEMTRGILLRMPLMQPSQLP